MALAPMIEHRLKKILCVLKLNCYLPFVRHSIFQEDCNVVEENAIPQVIIKIRYCIGGIE